MGRHMVSHADLHDAFDALVRANTKVLLGLLWASLAACVAGSVIYDAGHWLKAW
jgi:membrane-associated phospholipid phosphatase